MYMCHAVRRAFYRMTEAVARLTDDRQTAGQSPSVTRVYTHCACTTDLSQINLVNTCAVINITCAAADVRRSSLHACMLHEVMQHFVRIDVLDSYRGCGLKEFHKRLGGIIM
jgi:hypothetical protein